MGLRRLRGPLISLSATTHPEISANRLPYSGVSLNWSSLVVVLKGEGVYSDLCTNSTVPANAAEPPTVRQSFLALIPYSDKI